MSDLNEALDAIVGERYEGGCDDCTAYQEVERLDAGMYAVHVFHDAGCPTFTRLRIAAGECPVCTAALDRGVCACCDWNRS